jgi:multisubunit Na+/H+ antiporter MnhB subunit
MNEPAVTFAIVLLAVAVIAAAVMLGTSRRPGSERLSRAAFWIVIGILFAFIGLFAFSFLEGWYGGIGD